MQFSRPSRELFSWLKFPARNFANHRRTSANSHCTFVKCKTNVFCCIRYAVTKLKLVEHGMFYTNYTTNRFNRLQKLFSIIEGLTKRFISTFFRLYGHYSYRKSLKNDDTDSTSQQTWYFTMNEWKLNFNRKKRCELFFVYYSS